ncbi:hypothetical protein LCGC14_0953640 [marine sediment metagenome]|uniref:Uncharacterized protein n=1 Tax=marine sediment metagenome TaxID=412755 RepID=A0A0F9NL32_9ZZZZ
MNNKGQVLIFTFMIMMAIIVLIVGSAPAGQAVLNQTMHSTGMDCDNSSISTFDRTACVAVDMGMFYFLIGLIAIAFAVFFGGKFR